MPLEIVWLAAERAAELSAFVREHFGGDAVQSAPGRLAWLASAPGDAAPTAVVRQDGRPVAMCCHVPAGLQLDGAGPRGGFGIDMMVAPEARRRGIARDILSARHEHFDLGLSTGQSPAMAEVYRRRGPGIELARWHLGIFRRGWSRPANLRAGLRDLAARWKSARSKGTDGTRSGLALEQALPLVERFADRTAADEAGVRATPAWFAWRYAGTVYRDYRFVLLRDEHGAEGLVVLRDEPRREVLVDLYCRAEDRCALLHLAGATTRQPELRAGVAGETLVAALDRAGYFVRPSDAVIVASAADRELLERLGRRRWISYAGEADADLIRHPAPEGTTESEERH